MESPMRTIFLSFRGREKMEDDDVIFDIEDERYGSIFSII